VKEKESGQMKDKRKKKPIPKMKAVPKIQLLLTGEILVVLDQFFCGYFLATPGVNPSTNRVSQHAVDHPILRHTQTELCR